MSRFDYVKYDIEASIKQKAARSMCEDLEELVESMGQGRAQSMALTKIEEAYMWIGKAIRDDQINREKK